MEIMKKGLLLFLCATLLIPNQIVAGAIEPGDTVTQNIDVDTATDTVGSENAGQHKGKPPIFNLFDVVEWSRLYKEFEIEMKIGFCGCGTEDDAGVDYNFIDCAIGLKASMIEPIGFFERTNKPLYFPFADIDLGGNVYQFNNPYKTGMDEEGDSPRENTLFGHFIYFPILGIIFKKKLNFVCFHRGDLDIPYLSEFDPTYKQDYYYMKMIPQMVSMFSPDALLGTFFDCSATMIANAIQGYSDDKSQDLTSVQDGDISALEGTGVEQGTQSGGIPDDLLEYVNRIRNAIWFVDGCNGFSPIGGYQNGQDPITETTNDWYGIANILHGASALLPLAILEKQTNAQFGGEESKMQSPEQLIPSMCAPKKFPMIIPTQYSNQLAYPLVGSGKEMGATGMEVSTGKNLPIAKGYVFIPWIRRDYYAFAYFCPGADDETGAINK